MEYTLTDARKYPQQYRALFQQYCTELSESDPTISQYDPNELADENLQSSLDHPNLIEADGEMIGLVVFMDEEAPHDIRACHSYLGEIFVLRPFRCRGIAGRIIADYLKSQTHDLGLCFVRGSSAEQFWRRTVSGLGCEYDIFTVDEIRDFMHIHIS